MESDEVIKLPALGRPFRLGMLYDRRNDDIVPEEKLWDPQQMAEQISERPQPGSDYELITSDSLDDKTSSLQIDANLKLSLLGGLVNVGGSAKFLNDKKVSSNIFRVSSKYSCITSFKELKMKQLATSAIIHHGIFDKQIATHVVVGIMYGAQAVLVFDREVEESEDKNKVEGELKAMVKSIPDLSIEGMGAISLSEGERKKETKLRCRFYGDICLPTNPTTYEEAIKIYQQLPMYIGEKGENCIPIQVWLYPLSKLDNKEHKLVRDISTESIKAIGDNLESLENIGVQCSDLMNKNTCKYIPTIKNRIVNFCSMVNNYRQKLQTQLADLVPRIRGFGKEETELLNLLQNQNRSPFNLPALKQWLSDKKQEVNVLETYVQSIQGIYVSADITDVARKTFEHDYVILLKLVLPVMTDSVLRKMSDAITLNTENSLEEISDEKLWFKNKNVQLTMRNTLKAFISFVNDNKNCKNIFMMVTIVEDESADDTNCAKMTLYENGVEHAENFVPPGQPGKPDKVVTKTDSVTIRWNAPETGDTFIDHYEVEYRCENDENWKKSFTPKKETCHSISKLQPNTNYQFRVKAVFLEACGKFGELSDDMYTSTTLATVVKATSKLTNRTVPSVYKLPLVEARQNKNAKTRKFVFGKPRLLGDALTEKTIMLVGATGSGKSTLIDGFINYILNVKWVDDFRFSLVDLLPEESAKKSEAESRTEWITSYKINCMEGSTVHYTLNLIDTPGYGDTRGIKRDKEITEQVRQLFTDPGDGGVTCIDAICFVTQAPLARLTPSQKYVFSSILSIFGADIIDNILVLITFADGNDPPVLEALKHAEVPFKNEFRFNNSALFASNVPNASNSFAPMFWDMGLQSFKKFFTDVSLMTTKSLQLTKEVLEERKALELIIGSLQPEIDVGLSKLNALRDEEIELKKHEDDIKENRDFEYYVDEVFQEQIYIAGKPPSTFCTKCNKECHDVCAITENDQKRSCIAMGRNGYCTVCDGKCLWNQHINAPWKLQPITKKVKKIYNSKVENLKRAEGKHTEKLGIIATIKKNLEELEANVYSMMKTMIAKIARLKQIALKPNPLTVIDYIDQMIENEKNEKKPGFQQRIQELTDQRKKAVLLQQVEKGELKPKFK